MAKKVFENMADEIKSDGNTVQDTIQRHLD